MVAVAGGVLGILHGGRRLVVGKRLGFIGLLQAPGNVVALAIDCWIDLVGDAVVPVILGEANIVSAGAAPYLAAFPGKWCLPDAEVMAAGNHGDGLGHFVAEILPPSEQKQRTHGNRQVILTVISLHESIEHGFFVVGIE